MVKCVVSGCPNRVPSGNQVRTGFGRPRKRFFNFPTDPARVKVWLAALRQTDRLDSLEQQLICEDHFLPEDLSRYQVKSDAIPIMPPCLDSSMSMVPSWEEEEQEEQDQWATGEAEEEEEEEEEEGEVFAVTYEGGDDGPAEAEPPAPPPEAEKMFETKQTSLLQPSRAPVEPQNLPRKDMSLGVLTRCFLQMLQDSPDGSLDLRDAQIRLNTRRRRLYDITNVLEGVELLQKCSAHRFTWIGGGDMSSFLWRNEERLQREVKKLQLVEDALDNLIKTCAQQLFTMTDDLHNAAAAYVTHEDIGRLPAFQQQTVIAVKAPEETKLEVPAPREDSIQVHLKAERGPIAVVTSDLGADSSFLSLEHSRIRSRVLPSDSSGPQSTVRTA